MPSNNAMQLTKLRAAPVLQAEVPPCAPAGRMDGGTASQLIASVRPTVGEQHEEAAPGVTTARGVNPADGAAAAPQKWVLARRLQPIQARSRVSGDYRLVPRPTGVAKYVWRSSPRS